MNSTIAWQKKQREYWNTVELIHTIHNNLQLNSYFQSKRPKFSEMRHQIINSSKPSNFFQHFLNKPFNQQLFSSIKQRVIDCHIHNLVFKKLPVKNISIQALDQRENFKFLFTKQKLSRVAHIKDGNFDLEKHKQKLLEDCNQNLIHILAKKSSVRFGFTQWDKIPIKHWRYKQPKSSQLLMLRTPKYQIYRNYLYGQEIAIKFYNNDQISIQREFGTLKSLKHKNIIRVIGIAEYGNRNHLITEFCSSGTFKFFFREKFEERQNLVEKIRKKAKKTLQIVYGLKFLRIKRVAHCDITPWNIFVNGSKEVKIANFESSRIQNFQTYSFHQRKREYVSPQILSQILKIPGKKIPVSTQTDIWSLNMTMYRIFLGKKPYLEQDKSNNRVLLQKIQDGLKPDIKKWVSLDNPDKLSLVLNLLIDTWITQPQRRLPLKLIEESLLNISRYQQMDGQIIQNQTRNQPKNFTIPMPKTKESNSFKKIQSILSTNIQITKKNIKQIYFFTSIIFLTKFLAVISNSSISRTIFFCSLIGIFLIVTLFILFLFLFLKQEIFKKSRTILAFLFQFSVLILALTDQKNLNGVFEQNQIQALTNPLYVILINSLHWIFIKSNKKQKFVIQLIMIAFYSMFSLSCSQKYMSRMFTDLLSVLAFSFLFWNSSNSNSNQEPYQNQNSHLSKPNQEQQINFQSVMIRCNFIQDSIKKAIEKIPQKKLKSKLNGSLIEISRIKQLIAQGNIRDFNFQSIQLDQQDKTFITENFTSFPVLSKNNSGVSPLVRAKIQKIIHLNSLRSSEDKISLLLGQFGQNWNFNIWKIQQQTGQSISIIGKHLLQQWEIDSEIDINEKKTQLFFKALQDQYHQNPYHNACHAVDVMNSFIYFIKHSFLSNQIEMLQILACFLACLGHDVGHPGLTNRYLINSRDKLALKYNDKSVLQNMHISKIFSIMSNKDCDILSTLQTSQWEKVRQIVIEMVLSTDMAKHFQSLARFRARTEMNSLHINKLEDRVFVFSLALQSADIGHTAKQTQVHVKWTELIQEEFFRQGDLEKEREIPVSMYCNRLTTNIPKSQVGFMKNIALPLFQSWNEFLQSREVEENVIQQIGLNIQYWESQEVCKFSTQEFQAIMAQRYDRRISMV